MEKIICSFENYLLDFQAKKYPDYYGLDEDYKVYSNQNGYFLHRFAGYYLRGAMLIGEAHPLSVGTAYAVEFNVKLSKFAQTNGAVKLLNNASPSYPWAPATEYTKDVEMDLEKDYVPCVAIKDLLDGKWHKISFNFVANAPYIALQTPGYAELDFSDFTFEAVSQEKLSENKVDYTEYEQIRVKNAKYFVACDETANYSITLQNETATIYPVSQDEFKVGENLLNEYTFVLPRVHSYLYTEGLNILNSALESVEIKLNMCYDEEVNTHKLIFVDTTSFTTPIENKDNYSVYVKDGNLYINGGSDLAVYTALKTLADILSQNAAKGLGVKFKNNAEFYGGAYVPKNSDYLLTFNDEFTSETLDKSVWGNFWGRATENVSGQNPLGGDKRCASPLDDNPYAVSSETGTKVKPIEIINNQLHMRAIKAKEVYCGGKKINKTDLDTLNSCISTIGKLHFKYGVLEISCQIAGGVNYGALWANGDISGVIKKFPNSGRTAFSEFDLTESFGYGDYAAPCIHKWWRNGEGYLGGHNSLDGTSSDGYGDWRVKQIHHNEREGFLGKGHYFSTEQHIYTYSWTPDGITIAIDGKVMWDYDYTKYKGTSICNCSKHYILTSDFSKYLKEDSPEITDQIIDYVRIYQIPDRGDCLINSISDDNYSN